MNLVCREIITTLTLLAFLSSPQMALAQSLPKKQPIVLTMTPAYSTHLAVSSQNPITTVAKWPRRRTRITYKPRSTYYPLNCVSTLKMAGLLPNKPVTRDGYARTIPTKPLEINEGEKAVIKTTEGWTGHVLLVTKKGGQLISTIEGGYRNGVGRVVPPSVVVGEVHLAK